MSLSHTQFQALVTEIAPQANGARFCAFVEIGPRRFVLEMEKQHKRSALLLSFQEPFLRFHLLTRRYKATQTSLTKQIEHYLSGTSIDFFEQAGQDRILHIQLSKKGQLYSLLGEFFPRKPNLYLMDSKQRILLTLNPSEIDLYKPPSISPKRMLASKTEEVVVSNAQIESQYEVMEREALFTHEKQIILKTLQKRLKQVVKLKEKSQENVDHCQKWEEVQHLGKLLQANLFRIVPGRTAIRVEDWEQEGQEVEIALKEDLTPSEQAARLFTQARKLREGLKYAELRVHQAETEIEKYNQLLLQVQDIGSRTDLKPFYAFIPPEKGEGKQKLKEQAQPYHRFLTESGIEIWAGKSATDNEQLTFSLANGSDWWIHVRDFPGSHVVVHTKKNQEPDSNALADAMQVALAYSKAKHKGKVDLVLTQCKYVSRLGKGRKGQVQLSKYQVKTAVFDAEHFQRIKTRIKAP